MSERGKRVFRFLLDPERDADVIGRIEARPSMTGYVRELVRRDTHEREMHDERLDFAALKASELQAENAKLRELLGNVGHILFSLDIDYCGACTADNVNRPCPVYTVESGECLYKTAMRKLGIEVEQ